MTARLSAKAIVTHLEIKAARLERDYGFDGANGWDQVRGKGEEVNRAYGQYVAMRDLLNAIEWRCLQEGGES